MVAALADRLPTQPRSVRGRNERVAQLDRQEIEALYRDYSPMIRRRIRRFYRNPQEVDDVLQEVFVRALDKLSTYRGEAQASTWLYALTTRYCLNRIRGARRRQELWEQEGGVAWSQPVTVDDRTDQRMLLGQLLEGMDEELQLVATLYYVDDLSHGQIAEILGVSRRTVGNRLEAGHTHARSRAGGL